MKLKIAKTYARCRTTNYKLFWTESPFKHFGKNYAWTIPSLDIRFYDQNDSHVWVLDESAWIFNKSDCLKRFKE